MDSILTPLQRMFLEDLSGEDTSGKASIEVEHVFYGKIADANQLVELAKQPFVKKVLQEQYQFKVDSPAKTTIRARRLNRENAVLTSKTYAEGQDGMIEKTIEITDEVFEFIRQVAGEGINKMRYTIQPEGWERPLELDVFVTATGAMSPYAKIDYEVESEEDKIPSLPIILADLKHYNPFRATEEEQNQLKQWMQAQSFRV